MSTTTAGVRRRRRKHEIDVMLSCHSPESAGVRCANGLALVEQRGAAMNEWAIDTETVAYDPANIGGGPGLP